MYTYKTEILTVSTKWFSDKANAADISMLDQLLNERAAEGWELAAFGDTDIAHGILTLIEFELSLLDLVKFGSEFDFHNYSL